MISMRRRELRINLPRPNYIPLRSGQFVNIQPVYGQGLGTVGTLPLLGIAALIMVFAFGYGAFSGRTGRIQRGRRR